MIDQDLLVRSVTEATREVFATMLDIEVTCIGLSPENPTAASGLIALIGITGAWGGSGVFCCSPLMASLICSRMLGGVFDPVKAVIDEEVLDVVAELANMMIGNVKNGLEPVTGPLAISVPTVIHGKNFQFRNALGLRGVSLMFAAEGEEFEVRISLAPTVERNVIRSRIPILGLAQA